MADRWLAHQDRFLWSSRSASFSPVRTGFRPLQRDRKLPTPESSAELDPKQVSATHAARNTLAHHIERPQERAASIMTDPAPQTRRWVRLRRDNFIKDREHRRMASYVVDFDEGGAPVEWPQRRECQWVGL